MILVYLRSACLRHLRGWGLYYHSQNLKFQSIATEETQNASEIGIVFWSILICFFKLAALLEAISKLLSATPYVPKSSLTSQFPVAS